ncbi:MAG: RHS repeat-associated core domain-containing protein [Prevotellaceae bacterium]|jgi:RHS repeat-associated protein|nr:RHS repeat-associated core domain-containing protein [Prevotellaceae bacterium]
MDMLEHKNKIINYFITDHLGSTRAIVNANEEVTAQYNYYPFGKQWEDANSPVSTNRYRFSGKEKQTIRDLGWLDFSARMYANCEIPIFTTPDPLMEKYYSISPYAYCMNNPLKYVDPDGRQPFGSRGLLPISIDSKAVLKQAKEIVRGTTNSVLTIAGVVQIIAGTPFMKNGKHPNWSVPLQWTKDDKLEQKHSWMKDKLSWEDGKDLMENTLGAVLFFVPFSSAASSSERFLENTIISAGISTVANEVLPSQSESTNSADVENNNVKEPSKAPTSTTAKETMQKLLNDAEVFYNLIKDKIEKLIK